MDEKQAIIFCKVYYTGRKKSVFADYHVHTEFSDDSVYLIEDVIRDAVGMGMEEICITDHVDYGIKKDWDSGEEILYRDGDPLANVDYPRYMEQIQKLKERWGEKIQIRIWNTASYHS